MNLKRLLRNVIEWPFADGERKIEILKAKNPYWNENGILVKDFDNHNVAISPLKIK